MRCFQHAVTAVAVIGFASVASAADLPIKMAPPVVAIPAPVPTWTGCYIGGNFGAAWVENDVTLLTVAGFPEVTPEGTGAADAAAYGGQAGCDYQFNSNWVVGLRGMWDGTSLKTSTAGAFTPTPLTSTVSSKTTDFGTAVARVGYNLTPSLMVYGLGGVAFANNKYSQAILVLPAIPAAYVGNDAPTGYAVGGGASLMFSPNWDFFVEYNYMGFESRIVSMPNPLAPSTIGVTQHVQTILAGVDFRFSNWAMGQFGPK